MKRTVFQRVGVLTACLLVYAGQSYGELRIKSHYSPRNSERPKRKSTEHIILHTTEGSEAGSLRKVRKNGEAHYLVAQSGKIYRIIHRDRVAFHAGVSMWKGRTNLDRVSVGIEAVGYHDSHLTVAQYEALRELVSQLQRIYKLGDEQVLTHSMIAYGKPNRWHRKAHRGRKRCGMLFARSSVRRRLGITKWPTYDPDVRAKRLVVADSYLHSMLYGEAGRRQPDEAEGTVVTASRSPWDIAGPDYNSAQTLYRFPSGKEVRGDQIRQWKRIPVGTLVMSQHGGAPEETLAGVKVPTEGTSARKVVGEAYDSDEAIYLLPDGRVRTGSELTAGELEALSSDTKVLVGYVNGGYITSERSAFEVCGVKWNYASTLYRLPDGSLQQGNRISARGIPRGTIVFFRQD